MALLPKEHTLQVRTTVRCGGCKVSAEVTLEAGATLYRCGYCRLEQMAIVPVAADRWKGGGPRRDHVLDLTSLAMSLLRSRLSELDLLRADIACGRLDTTPVVFAGASRPPTGWYLLSRFPRARRRILSQACALERDMIAGEVQRRGEAWDTFHEDKAQIKVLGDSFERFVGRGYEAMGYVVQYPGLGVGDRGIDLICENDGEILLVQCKYYRKSRRVQLDVILTLHESRNRFMQSQPVLPRVPPRLPSDEYFGMPSVERSRPPAKNVVPVIVTTSTLSAAARSFAQQVGIGIRQAVEFGHDPHRW